MFVGQKGFYFDLTACNGCRTCQVACKDKNNLDVGIIFRKVRTFETGKYPEARLFHFSGSCNHCAEAKCVKGCPTGAMYYAEDRTVQFNKDKCIGCSYCVWNCPYGAVQYIEEIGVVSKCDSCIDLRNSGENPACVDACVMRCLEFGDLDELAAKYGSGLTDELPILPLAHVTEPSLRIKPKNCALNPNYKEKEV